MKTLCIAPLLLSTFAACTSNDHTVSGDPHAVGSNSTGHTVDDQPDGGATVHDPAPAESDAAHAPTGVEIFETIPKPAIVVANGGAGTVSIIDPATLAVVASVSVMPGMHPHHIGISPDKGRLLITATSADLSLGHATAGHGTAETSTMVYLLDVASKELSQPLTVQATAHNAAFTSDGATIVLGMMEHGVVAGYDASTFAETFAASGFEMPLEVTPTGVGSLLVAESGASRVAVLDLTSRTVSARFDVGAPPVAAWASGGKNYFVASEEGKHLSHLIEDSSGVMSDSHNVDLGGMPGQALLSPDGSELWVAVEDLGAVAILDATSHETLAQVAVGTKPHGIAFDPNGQRAFVTDEGGGKLIVVDTVGRVVSSEIELGGKPNGIVWLSK